MSTLPKTHLTPEEYLEIERKAEFKNEYLNGEMFAIASAQEAHILIAANTFAALRPQLRQKGCQVVTADLRVHVHSTGLYAYPDVVAYCGEPQLLDEHMDTLLNPVLIAEFLSPSTEIYDRTRKWEQYQSVESLREYLLISSDRVHVDLYTRQADRRWMLSSAGQLEDNLEIPSLGCALKLTDIYDQIQF
jgi:Uma2 family endonuclease